MKALQTLLAIVALSGGMLVPHVHAAKPTLGQFNEALNDATEGKKGKALYKAAAKVLKQYAPKNTSLVDKFADKASKKAYKSKLYSDAANALAKSIKKLYVKNQGGKNQKAVDKIINNLKGKKTDAIVARVVTTLTSSLPPAQQQAACTTTYTNAGLPPNCPS